MSQDPATSAFGALRRAGDSAQRWMRPIGPIAVALATWITLHSGPVPGLSGSGLEVSVALGLFLLGSLGAMLTVGRPGSAYLGFLVVLPVASGALVWLQPSGAGTVGLVLTVVFLTRRVPGRVAVPVTIVIAVFLSGVIAITEHGSIPAAVLSAFVIAGASGWTLLVERLGAANEQAERLLVELDRSWAAEARAAGLAERQRLAREMHDVLAHSLSGLMLQLEGARMLAAKNPSDPRLPVAIDRAHHLGKTGLEEARRAIGMLRDDELPGPERLAELAAQFQQDLGIPCQLAVCGAAPELSTEAGLALYRVAQEALTNIAKHTCADRVELNLAHEPRGTRLTIEDFAITSASGQSAGGDDGYGLTGMRERAELLGGTLTTAMTGSGFRVELDLPAAELHDLPA